MSATSNPKIAPEVYQELRHSLEEEKQVIVHCSFLNENMIGNLIRIWPSTYLIDSKTGSRSQLLFWDNISVFPYWTEVPPVKEYRFTLIFSGLRGDCEVFDFVEEIPEAGGFLVKGIQRNDTDVYHILL